MKCQHTLINSSGRSIQVQNNDTLIVFDAYNHALVLKMLEEKELLQNEVEYFYQIENRFISNINKIDSLVALNSMIVQNNVMKEQVLKEQIESSNELVKNSEQLIKEFRSENKKLRIHLRVNRIVNSATLLGLIITIFSFVL